MGNRIYKIRILLSSPGNLAADRDVVRKVIDNINLDSGAREGFHAELITWETHTRPSVGKYSQEVINEQFPKDLDIFIGMMGTYFGTPTPNWGSGTEEEFRIAFENYEVNGVPDIMFYFSNAVASLRDVNSTQLLKVDEFKRELGELGVYYWQYDDQAGLTLDLHRQLAQSIIQIKRAKEKGGEEGDAPDQSAILLPNYSQLIVDNPVVAIEVLVEQAVAHLEMHTSSMISITDAVNEFSARMKKVERDLRRARENGNTNLAKKASTSLSDALKRYRGKLYSNIPHMRSEFEESMMLMQRALLLRRENSLESEIPHDGVFEGAKVMRDGVLKMREAVVSTNDIFVSEFKRLPAFSTQTDIIVALHKDIAAYVDSVDRLVMKFCEDFQ